MDFDSAYDAVGGAWVMFYESLRQSGFTDEQIKKFDKLLDGKDCFNDVIGCAMEAVR